MPWTAADAHAKKKGLSPKQARQWARVANQVLADTGDEGRAIRAANSAVGAPKGKKKGKG